MSVLIKGMKMPIGCITCPCMSFGRDDCTMWCKWLDEPLGEWSKRGGKWRHPDCPLVEVSTPHGPLIDEAALMLEFAEFVRASNNSDFAAVPNWNDAVSLLGSAPTIIEAEEGEEDE